MLSLQNGPGKVLQRHRYWQMIETSGGNWSDIQQHSTSTTTIGQETDDDDDDANITIHSGVMMTRLLRAVDNNDIKNNRIY